MHMDTIIVLQTLYVLSEEGDHQQLLRAELKLVKSPTATTLVVANH